MLKPVLGHGTFMEVAMRDALLEQEFAPYAFSDRRLYERALKIVGALASNLGDSLATATENKAGLQAAWRFFSNPRVTEDDLLAHHRHQTLERMRKHRRVLLIQDSTQFDLTRPRSEVKGTGVLDHEKRRGVFAHLLMAYSEAGAMLGNVWMTTWVRESLKRGNRTQKRESLRQRPLEEKESYHWVRGLECAFEVAEQCPEVDVVYVADMGADIYEVLWGLFGNKRRGRLHGVIRVRGDRKTEEGEILKEYMRRQPVLFRMKVKVSAREAKVPVPKEKLKRHKIPRQERVAVVEVRASRVRILPPRRLRGRKRPEPIEVYVVYAVERLEGNEGLSEKELVEWVLVTDLPVESEEDAREIMEIYAKRFGIETLFRTLKSECRVEKRLFRSLDRFLKCLALHLVIAWRLHYLQGMSREQGEEPADRVFTLAEIALVYLCRGARLPDRMPTVAEVTWLVAQLGGYMGPRDGRVGPRVLRRGLMKLMQMARLLPMAAKAAAYIQRLERLSRRRRKRKRKRKGRCPGMRERRAAA